MPITLDDQFQSVEATSAFQRLVDLDKIRTNYLQNNPSVAPSDIPSLERITSAMDQLIAESSQSATNLMQIALRNPQELEQRYAQTLKDSSLTSTQKDKLRQLVEKHAGIVPLITQATEAIVKDAPGERAQLAAQMQTIRESGPTQGDLSQGFYCNLAAGFMVGGCLTIETGVGAFAAGFGLGLAIGFDC